MRTARLIAVFFVAAITPAYSLADPSPMTQAEFETLIAGNSIVGVWGEAEYRQYFHNSGSTTYVERGGSPSQGYWRIDSGGRYCSTWPPSSHESCYDVERDGDELIWHVPSTELTYSSIVVTGKQLSW